MKHTLNILKTIFIALLFFGITSCTNEKKTDSKIKNQETMSNNNAKHTVLINPFEVPKGKLEASIKYWEDCRDFFKNSTRVHINKTTSVDKR